MLEEFSYPYISILKAEAWSIEQILDGLGLIQISIFLPAPGTAPSPTPFEGMRAIFNCLLVYSIFLSIFLLVVGYVLRRKRGLLSVAILLMLPGLLGVFGIWPSSGWVPERYILNGSGELGTPLGTVSLLFLGLLSGWSITILVVDIFAFKNGFWHAYDHVWCVAALLAGIFFVVDAEMNQHQRELDQNTKKISQTSFYLLRQVELYDAWCLKNGHTASASCQWANTIQSQLSDYAYSGFVPGLTPKYTAQIYGGGTFAAPLEETHRIRTEIAAYNRLLCPVTDLGHGISQYSTSSRCNPTPIAVAEALPEYLDGEEISYDPYKTTALASELLIPNIIRLGVIHDKLVAKEQTGLRDKQFRWVYYIFFSLVIGGKIANATAKLTKMSERTRGETRRSLYLFRRIIMLARRTYRSIPRLISISTTWLKNNTHRLFSKLKQFGRKPA